MKYYVYVCDGWEKGCDFCHDVIGQYRSEVYLHLQNSTQIWVSSLHISDLHSLSATPINIELKFILPGCSLHQLYYNCWIASALQLGVVLFKNKPVGTYFWNHSWPLVLDKTYQCSSLAVHSLWVYCLIRLCVASDHYNSFHWLAACSYYQSR